MTVVNPVLKWRGLIAPPATKNVAEVMAVNASVYSVKVRGGTLIDAQAQGGAAYIVGNKVLIEEGQIIKKLGDLIETTQGV